MRVASNSLDQAPRSSVPDAVFGYQAPYLPGFDKALRAALHAVHDADGCLLGLQVPGRFQDRVSKAMRHHREAVQPIRQLLQIGGLA